MDTIALPQVIYGMLVRSAHRPKLTLLHRNGGGVDNKFNLGVSPYGHMKSEESKTLGQRVTALANVLSDTGVRHPAG